MPGSGLTTKQAWGIAAVVGGAAAACGLLVRHEGSELASAFAASQATSAQAVAGHQGRAVSRIAQVARVVAAPAIAGVANSAAANRDPSALRSAQHRNIRAGR